MTQPTPMSHARRQYGGATIRSVAVITGSYTARAVGQLENVIR
jgi:hypothetical protein